MATSRETQARSLISSLRIKLQNIRDRLRQAVHRPKVVCLEWLNPLFVAGHWVPEMVEQAEAFDVLGVVALPSRRCSREEVIASDPDILILMPCGFSADRAAREAEQLLREQWWGRLRAVRNNQVFTVDASSFFSRPGPRLIDGIAILAAVFHPDIFGTSFGPSVSRLSLTTPA